LTVEAPESACCFDLRFARDPRAAAGRTYIAAQRIAYPAHVCRGLYLDDDRSGCCTVLLQSVSGGLFEHDRIGGRIHAEAGAQVRVRSAASTVVHEMTGGDAVQSVSLQADTGAMLEWRPMPLILFPGARVETLTRVRRDAAAVLLLADAFLAHDATAHGRPFGELRNALDVHDGGGRLLVRERLRIAGADWLSDGPVVSGGLRAQGTLWWIAEADPAPLLEAWRLIEPARDEALCGATVLPNRAGAVFRVLARDGIGLARAMDAAVAAARTHSRIAQAAIPMARSSHEPASARVGRPDPPVPQSLGPGVARR
jgi:urease accessory protein